jgi:hypothetical protein
MSEAMPRERVVVRGVTGLVIVLLTVAWVGGTVALFVAGVDKSYRVDCQVWVHDCLLADRLVLGSVACACGFPLLAALVCAFTGRGVRAVLFAILGVSMALMYGRTVGLGVARDIHRIERPTSVPVPPDNCPCYSGGGCDCPGG